MLGEPLACELPLDHHLRGDAGVVSPGLPEGIATAQARIPDQDVLQRVVERVPHVQAAGDVRRRNNDGERRRQRTAAGGERARGLPPGIPFVFEVAERVGLVEHCFRQERRRRRRI